MNKKYNQYYQKRDHLHVYPVEFVVRTFLGTYPNLKMDKSKYEGSRLLDLGYGDGRNMPFFNNLGFKIYGIEISEEINNLARTRLNQLSINAELSIGNNSHIPYPDGFFDFIVACHSCCYLVESTVFRDNLNEITRVLKKGGVFVASLPMSDNFIFRDSIELSDGHFLIKNDPYKIRNNTIQKTFKSRDDVNHVFSSAYENISIGYLDDDYYGINVKVWIFKGEKK